MNVNQSVFKKLEQVLANCLSARENIRIVSTSLEDLKDVFDYYIKEGFLEDKNIDTVFHNIHDSTGKRYFFDIRFFRAIAITQVDIHRLGYITARGKKIKLNI